MTFNAKALGMTGVYLLVFVLAAFLVDSGSSPIGSLLIAAVVSRRCRMGIRRVGKTERLATPLDCAQCAVVRAGARCELPVVANRSA
jgi:hypothetical protein